MKKKYRGSILVNILIAVGIIALLAAVAFPAINRQRVIYQDKQIYENLHSIADTAQRYFKATGAIEVTDEEIIAFENNLRQSFSESVAGEDYRSLFPIDIGFVELSVTKADGKTVIYRLQLKYN